MKLMEKNTKMSKREFYLRSFTWGLPVNIGGAAVSVILLATDHKPHRFGRCVQFDVGKGWGGGSLGVFMFTCRDASKRLKAHEHGHSLQNCYYGPLMPLIVNIPSSARFWIRKGIQMVCPDRKLPPYDSIWFEKEATEIGKEYVDFMENEEKTVPEVTANMDEDKNERADEPAVYPILRTASRIILGGLAAVLAVEALDLKKKRK